MLSALRSSLLGLMELAETTGHRIQVAVVDDGSTDATYEVACELASEFPQLQVLRQPCQPGLGAAAWASSYSIGRDRRGCPQRDWRDRSTGTGAPAGTPAPNAATPPRQCGSHGRQGAGHQHAVSQPILAARLVEAHRSGGAFRWLRISRAAVSRRKRSTTPVLGAALDGLMPSMSNFGSPVGKS